ncbi:hypothetical protein [Flammeovirga pacifica]|uniref:Uncharacterized protein n=1 Tax=Flammeovirga pacifica TaxID=915059 RepID=A0A1S1Z2U9_FLAPC|nr:hypothetical protein [Flammeovirga pacifica]OHX67571.1 hypothetical protein NH26_15050 [Flammeovirga pacifica]
MKYFIYILSLSVLLFSCDNQQEEELEPIVHHNTKQYVMKVKHYKDDQDISKTGVEFLIKKSQQKKIHNAHYDIIVTNLDSNEEFRLNKDSLKELEAGVYALKIYITPKSFLDDTKVHLPQSIRHDNALIIDDIFTIEANHITKFNIFLH